VKGLSFGESNHHQEGPISHKSSVDQIALFHCRLLVSLTLAAIDSNRSGGMGDHPSWPDTHISHSLDAEVAPPLKWQLMPIMAMGIVVVVVVGFVSFDTMVRDVID
jgi:hypothetical protein